MVCNISGGAKRGVERLIDHVPARRYFLEVPLSLQFGGFDLLTARSGLVCFEMLKELLDVAFVVLGEGIED